MNLSRKTGAKRRQRKDGSFKASDGFGNSHLIDLFTELFEGEVEGPQSLVTVDGESVERLAKGRYRVIHGGLNLNLTSDDPAAP
jgi:hypothetical protein